MTAEQLKNSILQMAVQGKLVPQDPNDEPASELIKRIREEKEKLIKEGKIKKEKNPSYIFRGEDNIPYEKVGKNEPVSIADEVPFEIPESWCWERWGNISESIQYGYNAPAKDQGRIKMVRISDIQDNSVIWNNVPYCDISEAEIETYLLKKDDILFARTGGTVGKSYLVSDVQEESIYAGYLIRTRYSNRLCPQYLKFFMESPLYWEQLKVGTTATAQPNCNGQTLGKMFIPIPPRNEQTRIVEKINQLNTWIDKYRISETKLKSLTESFPACLQKSILQEAVMGKLVPQNPDDEPAAILLERIREEKKHLITEGKLKKDKHESIIYRRDNSHYEKLDGVERCIDDEIPFEIPDSWSWCRIKDIFETSSGTTPSKSNSSYYDFPKYNWVRTTDLNNDVLTTCEIKISKKAFEECRLEVLPYDSVCIAMYGGAGTIGKNALIRFETTINQSVCAIHPNGFINMEYVQLYIKYLRPEWMRYASGSRKDPNINQVIIKNMLIPIPPINEQIRIVISAHRVMNSCEKI